MEDWSNHEDKLNIDKFAAVYYECEVKNMESVTIQWYLSLKIVVENNKYYIVTPSSFMLLNVIY